MEIVFTKNALKDLKYWKKQKNKEILLRIESLLNDIIKNPFEGIGNPEPLKYQLWILEQTYNERTSSHLHDKRWQNHYCYCIAIPL